MSLTARVASIVVVLGAATLLAQTVGTYTSPNGEPMRQLKTENGLIISHGWGPATDSGAGRVDIYDAHLRKLVSLDVLSPIEGAHGVSVYDASARHDGTIAVAGVYSREENTKKIVATGLLLFDFNGRLRSAFAVNPQWGVRRVELDEKGNIWTLTDNFFRNDAPTAPMIVEYSAEGKVVRELLPRHELWPQEPPENSAAYREMAAGSDLGTTMGYDAGTVWFWLPGATTLVTISSVDGKVSIAQTGLPQRENHSAILEHATRDSSGDLVGKFRPMPGVQEVPYYAWWSPSNGKWSRFEPGECAGWPIGSSDAGMLYAEYHRGTGTKICAFQRR
jgi:hypothetical protein